MSKYIVFEGIPSAGKSTQFRYLQEDLAKEKDILYVFEPGGTEISNAIRRVVQEVQFKEEMDLWTEALLYAAARSQLLFSKVFPHLEKGGRVLSDRCFVTSLAYQGIVRGLGIDHILDLNKKFIEKHLPDYIIFFDIDIETSYARRNDLWGDKFEREDKEFFKAIKEAYYKVGELDLIKNRWIHIDASKTKEELRAEVKKVMREINFINE